MLAARPYNRPGCSEGEPPAATDRLGHVLPLASRREFLFVWGGWGGSREREKKKKQEREREAQERERDTAVTSIDTKH